MATNTFTLRPYRAADEDAAIELWLRSWRATYPDIDFAARLDWWRARWRSLLVPHAAIVVAEIAGEMTGFVTVDGGGYLDQLVVAPEHWGGGIGGALMAEAKRLAPAGLDLHVNQDNARAIRFYDTQGFKIAGESFNAESGRPTFLMRWRP